jgi:hypothetical protein
VLRICGALGGTPGPPPEVESALADAFGPVALRSRAWPFDVSDYYRDELGPEIVRVWYVFRDPCRPEALPDARWATEAIERRFAVEGRRRVNLDPGYLDLGKLVLASFKEAPDKIYLGRGVWAHTCLRYRNGGWEAPDHSFPDFRDRRYDAFMTEARKRLKELHPPPARDRRAPGPAR